MKFMKANRIAPDGTPHFVASHLGLFRLPMFYKKDTRFIWVNHFITLFEVRNYKGADQTLRIALVF